VQGLANYRIGLAYQKAEEASKALGFHSEYLSLCKVDADTVGEGEACCALAQCYQDLGDVAQVRPPPLKNQPHSRTGLMGRGGSGAAGFDRYWRSTGRH
jgi:hypothetical protein